MELNDFGYLDTIKANLERVKKEQAENIRKAAELMADAVANDRHLRGIDSKGALQMAGKILADRDRLLAPIRDAAVRGRKAGVRRHDKSGRVRAQ